MRWNDTRAVAGALALLALLPADLTLARRALRPDGIAAVARDGMAHAAGLGCSLLGRGAHRVGTTLVDAACRVADLATGHAPGKVWIHERARVPAADACAARTFAVLERNRLADERYALRLSVLDDGIERGIAYRLAVARERLAPCRCVIERMSGTVRATIEISDDVTPMAAVLAARVLPARPITP